MQHWKNNSWVNDEIVTYTYDVNRNLIEELWLYWGELSTVSEDNTLLQDFRLLQNYRNPFNPTATLRYDLPERTDVKLTIYDILGRKLRTLVQGMEEPGQKSVIWDGTNDLGQQVSAGV